MFVRRSEILHALTAIAGFAAGGTLVLLVVAMMPPRSSEGVALASARENGMSDARAIRIELELPTRAALPAPIDPRLGTGDAGAGPALPIDEDSLAALVSTLRDRDLDLPVATVEREDLRDDYDDPRPGGRTHEALDILAPRDTPVVAVEDGRIASLDPSQGGGGIVIYQYDPSGEFAYYYAHLEGYAEGLEEGQAVERGQILGYVGTSGNAPPDVPHLHFAIYKTVVGYRWWKGVPVNPFPVFR